MTDVLCCNHFCLIQRMLWIHPDFDCLRHDGACFFTRPSKRKRKRKIKGNVYITVISFAWSAHTLLRLMPPPHYADGWLICRWQEFPRGRGVRLHVTASRRHLRAYSSIEGQRRFFFKFEMSNHSKSAIVMKNF